ncbi:MAG: hypothetical protein ABI477_03225 [Chryseolinea sp.]
MKTASKKTLGSKTLGSTLSITKKPKTDPQKNIENTDLNVDDERTNADVGSENSYTNNSETQQKNVPPVIDPRTTEDTSVEEEQDREALRKMEDNHPDEMLN